MGVCLTGPRDSDPVQQAERRCDRQCGTIGMLITKLIFLYSIGWGSVAFYLSAYVSAPDQATPTSYRKASRMF
jgi:hypothetical protein